MGGSDADADDTAFSSSSGPFLKPIKNEVHENS